MMIRKALLPAQLTQLRRDSTVCVVIEAPTAEWVELLAKAAKRLGDWKFVHSAKEPAKPRYREDVPGDQAILALSAGGRTVGISHNPATCLPKAMTGSVDIYLMIPAPDDAMLREAIKAATGRFPRTMPSGVAAGLDYGDICAAIRVGSSAKACVERLASASKSKSAFAPGLSDVPHRDELHGYGAALDWGKGLILDLAQWRAGKLPFSAMDRAVVLASEPGLGKSTFPGALPRVPAFPCSQHR
ncbi:hypothetical protein [Devosia sp. RR2S18]|uniref:hypothetical protein n=1 Tax=Devosia rhizosphaerae TaxID=3049774 RepID=UPI00254134D2|nr:hypothetical protein [Devosia sp. RR2S18]WIJ24962.1 hypothetical protein QOV41_18435 [Devosia sp. RR2S18]